MNDSHRCRGCPVYADYREQVIPASGDPADCDLVIVGEGPGEEEFEQQAPFVGQSGRLLNEVLRSVGVSRDRCYVTNAWQCGIAAATATGGTPKEKTENAQLIERCKQRLVEELRDIDHDVPILVLGTYATSLLLGSHSFGGVMKLRGCRYRLDTAFGRPGSVYPTYHPAFFLHGKGNDGNGWRGFRAWREDIRRAAGCYEPDLEEPDILMVRNEREARRFLGESPTLEPGNWVVDLETTGLDPTRPDSKILCACFNRPGEANVTALAICWDGGDQSQPMLDVLEGLLKSPDVQWIAHNAVYERKWFREYFGIDLPVTCTMQAWHLLESDDFVGLDYLAPELGAPRYWSEVEVLGKGGEEMASVPSELLLLYCSWDVRVTGELYLREFGEDGKLKHSDGSSHDKLYRGLVHPMEGQVLEMAGTGFLIDEVRATKQRKILEKELKALQASITRAVGHKLNPNSHPQVVKYFFGQDGGDGVWEGGIAQPKKFSKKTKTPSADKEVMEAIDHPVARAVLRFRIVKKAISTWLSPNSKLMQSASGGGRIKADLLLHGTVTGRLACPGLHQIPIRTDMGKAIRSCFAARPGWCIVKADFSQLELRILAIASGDSEMQRLFLEGRDIHAEVAAHIFRVPVDEVNKDQRRAAKDTNFGIAYGQSATALAKRLGVDRDEAQAYISTFYEMFANVEEYRKDVIRKARKTGGVHSAFGRTRRIHALPIVSRLKSGAYKESQRMRLEPWDYQPYRLWSATLADIERSAFNSAIQGPGSDVTCLGCVRAAKVVMAETNWRGRYVPILTIHDELVWECNDSAVHDLARILKTQMEREDNPYRVSFPVDVEVGPSWGETEIIDEF